MAHSWSDATTQGDAGTPQQQVHLSDGTLVYLKRVSATVLELRYTSDHTTTNLIQSLTLGGVSTTFSNTGLASFALVRDASDNLFVIGPSAQAGVWRARAFTKGAGYTWTAQTEVSSPAEGTGPASGGRCWGAWCNTGGGTNAKGHILCVQATSSSGAHIVIDAGALLAGTWTETAGGNGASRAYLTSIAAGTIMLAADGFGATNGLAAYSVTSSNVGIGAWAISSAGAFTTSTSITTTLAMGTGTIGAGPALMRVASNVWAVVAATTLTASAGVFSVARYSATAQLTAPATKSVTDNAALTRTSSRFSFGVALDPSSGKLWLFYRDTTTGTTVRQLGIAVSAGVTFDVASAVYDTLVGSAGTDYVVGFEQETTSALAQDMLWANTTSTTVYDDVVSFDHAPNAPTLTAPTNASTQDLAAGFTFTWTFSDPDAGDTQTAYALRRKISGAGSYEWWNAGTGAWQGTEVFNASTVGSLTFAASKWTNGNTYNWSIATKDAFGVAGVYASDFTVVSSTAAVVTVSAPSGTVSTTSRPTVTWSFADAESDPQQTYQVKVESGAYSTTPGSGTSVWDSTETTSSLVRSRDVGVDLANGTSYRFFVRVKTNGQYSAWAFSTATESLSLPAVPTLAAALDTPNGRVMLTLQGRDNLLSVNTSSIETDTTGWAVVANATLSRSTAQFLDGAASLQLQSVAGGNMSATTPTGTSGIVVAPSTTYTALVSMRSAVSVRSCRIDVAWYTSAGALISTTLGTAANDATGSWVQVVCAAASPANAAFAALIVNVLATGAAAEVHFADQISLAPGSSTTWTRGGLFGLTVVVVEYQSTTGAWVAIRNSPFSVDANQAATVYDYEAPNHTLRTYRAKTQATI